MRRIVGLLSFAAAAFLLVPSQAVAQQQVTCSTAVQTIAGDAGASISVTCPAGCGASTAWGGPIYSDDSSICTAAIHAGVIQAASGGAVTVTIAPGQASYAASSANGISTSSWGSWGRSFTVAASTGPAQVTCSTNAQGLLGDSHTVSCPAGCGSSTAWGEDTYSDDSSICTAAIHAGVIQAATGGVVRVSITGGQASYPATSRNGVTTSSWGSWGRSFTVAAP